MYRIDPTLSVKYELASQAGYCVRLSSAAVAYRVCVSGADGCCAADGVAAHTRSAPASTALDRFIEMPALYHSVRGSERHTHARQERAWRLHRSRRPELRPAHDVLGHFVPEVRQVVDVHHRAHLRAA